MMRGEYMKFLACDDVSRYESEMKEIFIAKETANMRKIRCISDKDAGTLCTHIYAQMEQVTILKKFQFYCILLPIFFASRRISFDSMERLLY